MIWMMIDKWRSDPDHVTAPACILKHRFISELWSKPSNCGVVGVTCASPVCLSPPYSGRGCFFRVSPRRLWGRARGCDQDDERAAGTRVVPQWRLQSGLGQTERGGGQRERERERELLPTREFGISVTSTRTIQWLRLNQTWSFSYFNLWLFHYELK